MLVEEFEEYGSSGKVYQKPGVIADLDTSEDYGLSEFKFHDLSIGVTLMKYLLIVSGQLARRSSIWVCENGRWQLLHHQATVVANAN